MAARRFFIMRNFLIYLFTIGLFLSGNHLFSQNDCFHKSSLDVQNEEILLFELDYHWGLLWLSTGNIFFNVHSTSEGYTLIGLGVSKKNWNWFYPVNSEYTSYTDYSLKPNRSTRIGLEGKNVFNQEFTIEKNSIKYLEKNSKQEVTIDTSFTKGQCSYDVISAIYNFRYLDYNQYAIGDKIPIDILLDGVKESTYVKYDGIKTWKDPSTKEKYECYVLKPKLIEGTVFKSGENMTVYVSADEYRVPLYIETDLVVGKAKIFLKKVKNTGFTFIE